MDEEDAVSEKLTILGVKIVNLSLFIIPHVQFSLIPLLIALILIFSFLIHR